MKGRSRFRTRGRTGSNSLLAQATVSLGTAPLHYWDLLNNRALFNSVDVGGVTSTPGWSFTRASTGYAQDVAGNLISFGSGVLRRTNKGALIEGAGTNITTYSEDLSNAAWTKTNVTVVSGQTSPTGETTAYLIKEDTATGAHSVGRGVTAVSTATVRTLSVYVKAAGRTRIRLYMYGFNNYTPILDISTQSVVSATGGTAPTVTWTALAGGFYRVAITDTTTATELQFDGFGLVSTGTTFSYTGDGVSGVIAYGFQNELGAFASSYIPTTTASATRAADVLTVSSPGVTYPLSLFAEFERVVDTGGDEHTINAWFNLSNNAMLRVSSTDLSEYAVTAGGATVATETVAGSLALATTYKHAVRVQTNDFKGARGGTLTTGDTVGALPTNPTSLSFGARADGILWSYGYLRRAAVFSSALNDAQLQRAST